MVLVVEGRHYSNFRATLESHTNEGLVDCKVSCMGALCLDLAYALDLVSRLNDSPSGCEQQD